MQCMPKCYGWLVRFVCPASLALVSLPLVVKGTETNRWSGNGDWFDPAHWSREHVPGAGDHVEIVSGTVALTNSTAELASLTLHGGTLRFSNWDTVLSAAQVVVAGGGITHAGPFMNDAMSNRVHIVTSDFDLRPAGQVAVDAVGYHGGVHAGQRDGHGPGFGRGSNNPAGGAAHGGQGGRAGWGSLVLYGDPCGPLYPGSGGGSTQYGAGGHGGGAVRIDASGGTVTLNGTITANGGNGGGCCAGGGSGGSIYITAATVAGTSGVLRADGGTWHSQAGGGRIAVVYDTGAQRLLPDPARIQIWADSGGGGGAMIGTIYTSDDQILSEILGSGVRHGLAEWEADYVEMHDARSLFASDFRWSVAHDLTLSGVSRLTLSNSLLQVGGDVVMTDTAALSVYPGSTNGTAETAGAYITVDGALRLASGVNVHVFSHNSDGSSVYWQLGELQVAAGAVINANARGYAAGTSGKGFGPGGGRYWHRGSGGYGGKGGGNDVNHGNPYGDPDAPKAPGSGGGGGHQSGPGGAGGGLIWMTVDGDAVIDGALMANGAAGSACCAGGGSGGGIFLTADRFPAAYGNIQANGALGHNSQGGGSGGRIALLAAADNFAGTITASAAGSGENGSVRRLLKTGLLELRIQGDPANYGTAMPYDYGMNGLAPDTPVSISVNSPADEADGIRYVCLGWTLTNNAGVVASGVSTQASFVVDANLFLIWHWTNQFHLAATAAPGGNLVTDISGWYTNGVSVSLASAAANGYVFTQWTGTVPDGQNAQNPLTDLVLNEPRAIQANFATLIPTNKTWTGTGNWADAANWSPPGMPGPLDHASIASGTVTLTDPVSARDLAVNGTLRFAGARSLLQARNVTVNGLVTHAPVGIGTGCQATQAVSIVCREMGLSAAGRIDASGCGYSGGVVAEGHGPGKGKYWSGGAGYGGRGANFSATHGLTYGCPERCDQPGSGGGGGFAPQNATGGNGGGRIFLDINGTLRVDGAIRADGGNHNGGCCAGGGSGGGIYVNALRIEGSSDGLISAQGGRGHSNNAGGGGGRIALWRNRDAFEGLVTVGGGIGGSEAGTIVNERALPYGSLMLLR